MNNKKRLGIYIHIPFCIKKCDYCDFLSSPATKEVQNNYMKKLFLDIQKMADKKIYEVDSVFIGGGTPSVVDAKWLAKLMELLRKEFLFSTDAEVSMEANPGTVGKESLKIYYESGINRISFGLQSMNDEELKLLGRIHRKKDFLQAFYQAREAGFSNINVDLMSALPGQSVESYVHTLVETVKMNPEHISAYSLIIEEGTPFYQSYWEDEQLRDQGLIPKLLPGEEAEREMYEQTKNVLAKYGYERYEISNYAKAGFSCRHNLKYWDRKDYAGFGIGAASLLGNRRFRKTDSLKEYMDGDFEEKEEEILSCKEEMAEFMFLGLRKTAGVKDKDFQRNFAVSIEDVYGEAVENLIKEKLLSRTEAGLALTERGLDVSNRVFAEFYDI